MVNSLGVKISQFDRHKYAEKYCQELTRLRIKWTLDVEFDVPHEDDGETYIYDDFTVTEYR